MTKTKKGPVIGWLLYEGGNSAFSTIIMTLVFAPYFAKRIAVDPLVGAAHWGYAIALAGLLVGTAGPIVGALADLEGRLKPWLVLFTVLTMVSSALLWFAKPFPHYAAWTLGWMILGAVGFEISGIFHNTMLRHIVITNYWGRVSGWARGIGYLGGMSCLLLALLLISQPASWLPFQLPIDTRVRLCGPLVALWIGAFALPLFLLAPDKPSTHLGFKYCLKQSIATLKKTLYGLVRYDRSIAWLIGANVLLLDGLNTLSAMGGIYLSTLFQLNYASIIQFGIIVSISAAMGTIFLGWLTDYVGAKKLILCILFILGLLTTVLFFVKTFFWFQIIAVIGSLFVGTVYAASRSLLVQLSPPDQLAEIFSLNVLSGRITSFLGPWLAGTLMLIFNHQRVGMMVVPFFLLSGAALLLLVNVKGIANQ